MLNLMPAIPGTTLYQPFFNYDLELRVSDDGEHGILPSGAEVSLEGLEVLEEPREDSELVEYD